LVPILLFSSVTRTTGVRRRTTKAAGTVTCSTPAGTADWSGTPPGTICGLSKNGKGAENCPRLS